MRKRYVIAPIIIIIVSVAIACIEFFTDFAPGFFVTFGVVLLISTYITNTKKYQNKKSNTQQDEPKKAKQKTCPYCNTSTTDRKCPNCGARIK